jgi:hypothetical protein
MDYNMRVKKTTLILFAIIGLFSRNSFSQFCPGCIQNSSAPQNAVFNVSSGTVRGQFAAGTLSISTITVSTITANTAIIGPGSLITGLNASNISQGNISSNSVVGAYPGITQIGTINAGQWQGTPIGTQYGGTGQNFVNVSTGSLIYFGGNGVMDTLLPGAPLGILQSMGSAPEVWTSSPQVSGVNLYNIPLTSLNSGTLPTDIIVSSNSIPYVSGASVIGNISGQALGGFGGIINISQISTGTLPTDIVASSITVTGVNPLTYGGPSVSPQITLQTDGRISFATNTVISIQPSQISAGTLPSNINVPAASIQAGILNSGVLASSLTANGSNYGQFGSASVIPAFNSGNDGRLLNISTVAVSIPASAINTAIPFSQLSTGTLPTDIVASSITVTGVNAGSCGNGTSVCVVNFGTDGRALSATQTPITGASPTGAAGGALTGSYPNPRLAPTGVTATIYGNQSGYIPIIGLNNAGQVTFASQFFAPAISTAGALINQNNFWLANQTSYANWSFPQITVDTETINNLISGSSETLSGTLGVSGASSLASATLSGTLDVNGHIKSDANGGNLIFNADSGYEWWTGAYTDLISYQITHRDIATGDFSTYVDVSTAGYVGIGKTNPNAPLEISGINSSGVGLQVDSTVSIATIAVSGSSSQQILNLVTGASGAGNGPGLEFFDTGNQIAAQINTSKAATNDSDLVFQTANSGTMSEKMRILDNGNVGIGTRSPNEILTINGHISAQTGAPTLSGSYAGSVNGGSITTGSTDTSGQLDISVSASSYGMYQIIFNKPFSNTPFCVSSFGESIGSSYPFWTMVDSPSTTGVYIGFNNGTTVTQSLLVNWICIGH